MPREKIPRTQCYDFSYKTKSPRTQFPKGVIIPATQDNSFVRSIRTPARTLVRLLATNPSVGLPTYIPTRSLVRRLPVRPFFSHASHPHASVHTPGFRPSGHPHVCPYDHSLLTIHLSISPLDHQSSGHLPALAPDHSTDCSSVRLSSCPPV